MKACDLSIPDRHGLSWFRNGARAIVFIGWSACEYPACYRLQAVQSHPNEVFSFIGEAKMIQNKYGFISKYDQIDYSLHWLNQKP